jgi:ribonucleoside-diphosphate reductase alpha chain
MKEDVYDISVYDTTHTFQLSHCVTGNCGEIVLRPMGFCNLSSVVCRRDDQLEELKGKVRLATIIGTLQSMATDFHGLRPEWTKNAVEERLLGVDLNALMDCAAARRPWIQSALRYYAVLVNEQYAARLGINKAASVTCVKPSGNSSTLLNTSSGLHPRWSEYYIRNVRVSAHSPLKSVLEASGVPMSPENGQIKETATTFVAHFPVKSPEGAITKDDLTAIDKCNYWLQVKNNWTTHNPSVTITYNDDEVIDIAKWIYEHQDVIGGMAFLPHSDSSYDQMPYEEITEKDYVSLIDGFPLIDFSKIHLYELEDMTTAAQELSCMSGQCEF